MLSPSQIFAADGDNVTGELATSTRINLRTLATIWARSTLLACQASRLNGVFQAMAAHGAFASASFCFQNLWAA